MKRIVIFGATGTVGSYASIYFKKIGFDVIAIGRRKSDNGYFSKYNIPYYSCDISKKENFDHLPLEESEAVFHFAGIMPAKMEGYNKNEYIESIITGTLNVLEYSLKINNKRFVFSQSISDVLYKFGSLDPILPDVEMKFPLTGDHSIYSICKNTAVNLIQHYAAEYKFKHFILRFPTIYAYRKSPYYYVDGKERWLAYRYLINQAQNALPIEVWGEASNRKDMVYIKDLLQILEGTLISNYLGGIYNVGTGVGTSLDEFINAIIDVFSPKDKKSKKIYLTEKKASPQFILDINKTKNELNYEPKFISPEAWLTDFKIYLEKDA